MRQDPSETAIARGETLASAPTLLDSGRASTATAIDAEPAPLPADPSDTRYTFRASIGRGGMGDVRLFKDARTGRDVALKFIRDEFVTDAEMLARFLREARVQAQLEHPAIVPVYDLGRSHDGKVYFTMRRVQGRTLADVLVSVREGATEAHSYPRHRLLTAFATVCLAIEYAHARGVVHRDLKPANILIGDFGEVYVIDWGVARLGGAHDDNVPARGGVEVPSDLQTHVGAMLGTPGYMAPEQMRGPASAVDARADVYSLGAILFEILALEPLHGGRNVGDIVSSTLSGVETRPSVRAPQREVPPELDAICARATALDPADRLASARELHDLVERYLEGDRDRDRRRHASAELAARAVAVVDTALGGLDAEAADARREALADASRSLAFDPDNADARRVVVRLLTEPPRKVPTEAREAHEAQQRRAQQAASLTAAIAYPSVLVFVPVFLWAGIASHVALVAVVLLFLVTGLGSYLAARSQRASSDLPPWVVLLGFAANASMGLLCGPFILAPAMIATSAMIVILTDRREHAWRTIAFAVASLVGPLLLEWAGVIPPSYAFRDGTLVLLPRLVQLRSVPILATLVGASVGHLCTAVLFARTLQGRITDAQERLHVNAWQLKQLMPK